MKRVHLVQIASYLSNYKKIDLIERVEDTIIKVLFDRKNFIFFDMKRGDSHIFKADDYIKIKKYNAPFDVVLKKRFNNSKIEKIEVLKGNRILKILVNSSSRYKAQKSVLYFEFTGRNTNVIIVDEKNIVLEAYRHIDSHTSFREVKVGVKLKELPSRPFEAKEDFIEDVPSFLENEYLKRQKRKVEFLKRRKIDIVEKKIKKLQNIYDLLEDEEDLLKKSRELSLEANLILSNLHNMKNYQKELIVIDFEGKKRKIRLCDNAKTPSMAANEFFKRAKKLKQKAKFTYIERDNIYSKITFLKNLKSAINNAQSVDELNLYLPKQPKANKKRAKADANIETFFIEDYKIMVGKNEKGNISLLKSAKMSDIWMHIKDMPSTHVIIKNEKKSPPIKVLEFAAKLCVQFSKTDNGSYLVDFTARRNVKMREGAKVNYVNFDTIKVKGDSHADNTARSHNLCKSKHASGGIQTD